MSLRLSFTAGRIIDLEVDLETQQLAEAGESLETPVGISLFTDKRASADDLALAGLDPEYNRGWPGDSFAETDGDAMGSLLWLLDRALRNDETLALAERFALDALAWLIDDGVAQTVTVRASWIALTGYMQLDIEIVRRPGTRWLSVWNATTGALLRAA